jgi:hypothetical protein
MSGQFGSEYAVGSIWCSQPESLQRRRNQQPSPPTACQRKVSAVEQRVDLERRHYCELLSSFHNQPELMLLLVSHKNPQDEANDQVWNSRHAGFRPQTITSGTGDQSIFHVDVEVFESNSLPIESVIFPWRGDESVERFSPTNGARLLACIRSDR